ncbi:hypothetical protein YTPLAS72_36750 [Nitrospira sp.]|nr:hypothetical protein YTPLAS72_36750 [Nitrospira sp.]
MLLTVQDLSKRLQIKSSTLYAWVAQGKIPSLKLNGLIRFNPGTIEGWLTSSSTATERKRDDKIAVNRSIQSIDRVIADAKRAVYTPRRGRPDEDRANTKEVGYGSV